MAKTKDLKKFTQDLLEKLGLDAEVTVTEAEDNTLNVALEADNLGVIIGHHGDTLNSLQHILSLVATQQNGEFTRVFLDAGDWRKNRQEQLERMAQHAIEKVEQTGNPYEFPPMTPAERRLIHIYISEHSQLNTESAGEGSNRHIVLQPSQQ